MSRAGRAGAHICCAGARRLRVDELTLAGRTILNYVQDAAATFITEVELGTSEVGTLSFSDRPRQLFPHSTDAPRLLESIRGLQAEGGTDFENAFNGVSGGISLAAAGQHKRVLLVFTDGEGSDTDA